MNRDKQLSGGDLRNRLKKLEVSPIQPTFGRSVLRPRPPHANSSPRSSSREGIDGGGDSLKRLRSESCSSEEQLASGRQSATNQPANERNHRPGRRSPKKIETDPVVLARRQKQIDYGKNTLSYQEYTQHVPRNKRKNFHPRTPTKQFQMGRRQWDSMIKKWKIHIHTWRDPGALAKLKGIGLKRPAGTPPLADDDDLKPSVGALAPPAVTDEDSTSSDNKAAVLHSTPVRAPTTPVKGAVGAAIKMSPAKRRRLLADDSQPSDADDEDAAGSDAAGDAMNFYLDREGDDSQEADFSWADDVEELAKLMD